MRKKINVDYNTEFELDLAPLLAVMVKLVPVLLVSSAFVQMMIIETELPQVVQSAISKQQQEHKKTISMEVSPESGFVIKIDETGKSTESLTVPQAKDGSYDFKSLHSQLIQIKKTNPEVFQMDLVPAKNVAYKDIVKIMDEARRSHDSADTFPVFDEKKGQNVETNYMFPEIVFVNMIEG